MERLSILYATALFELAIEHGTVDELFDQAQLLYTSLSTPECQRILVHPHIPVAEKRDFFSKAFAGHVHDDLIGFLYLATDKNREAFIVPALEALIGMINKHNKRVTANVSTAAELTDEQITEMRNMLSKQLDKTVEISLKVDPTVIGGPYIFVDGYYLDWTVKKRLRDLTVHMKEGCSA